MVVDVVVDGWQMWQKNSKTSVFRAKNGVFCIENPRFLGQKPLFFERKPAFSNRKPVVFEANTHVFLLMQPRELLNAAV